MAQSSDQSGPARAARVKATLHHILSAPEFSPRGQTENAITRVLRWLGDEWQNFTQMMRRLWNALFGVVAGLHGTPALQWLFIVVFLALGTFVLVRLIRNLLHEKRTRTTPDLRPHVEQEPPTESLDPAHWMEIARLAASDMDYRTAYRAAYRATLLHLNRSALVNYDPARTNTEVLSGLTPTHPASIGDELLHFTQAFENRWFGSEQTNSTDYQNSMQIARRIEEWTSDKDKPDAATL